MRIYTIQTERGPLTKTQADFDKIRDFMQANRQEEATAADGLSYRFWVETYDNNYVIFPAFRRGDKPPELIDVSILLCRQAGKWPGLGAVVSTKREKRKQENEAAHKNLSKVLRIVK